MSWFGRQPPKDLLERKLVRALAEPIIYGTRGHAVQSRTFGFEWHNNTQPAAKLSAAATVGFIPGESNETNVVSAAGPEKSILAWLDRLAWRLLKASGNPVPPDQFADRATFLTFFAEQQREFRAAILVDPLEMFLNDGQVVALRCTCWYRMGYTPWTVPRAIAMLPNLVGLHWRRLERRSYSLGSGHVELSIDRRGAEIDVTCELAFKVSRRFQVAGLPVVRAWPPFASTRIRYTIAPAGKAVVTFEGTRIPSQRVYVGWASRYHHQYDMPVSGDLGAAAMDSFLNAELACKVAPLAHIAAAPVPIHSP